MGAGPDWRGPAHGPDGIAGDRAWHCRSGAIPGSADGRRGDAGPGTGQPADNQLGRLSLSILEAMRAGLPVVASSVGGIGEAILEGKTGFLVPPRDVEQVRDRIGQLLTDSALRVRLGTSGRARYEQQFTLGQAVSKTLAVYREVVAATLAKWMVKSPNSTSGRLRPASAEDDPGAASEDRSNAPGSRD